MGSGSLAQLDVLRGWAIVLMVVNHAGVRLLDAAAADRGPLAPLVFLGSFAPVVFFFATGFGSGLRPRRVDLSAFGSTTLKAALLIVADQFMRWKEGIPWGLDFLGFIALSTVLLAGIGATKRPAQWCLLAIAADLALRFVAGPWLQSHVALPAAPSWLLGVSQVPSVSYAFSPWIVYPLLGFALAHRYRALPQPPGAKFWMPLLCSAAAALIFSVLVGMSSAHGTFFRWGTMSLSFFVLSIAVLFISMAAVWSLEARWPALAGLLSLRGISSLAVVPVHYCLLEAFASSGAWGQSTPATLSAMACLLLASLTLAKVYASAIDRWLRKPRLPPIPTLGVTLVVCAVVVWAPQWPALHFAAFVVAQLAVTGLLGIRNRARPMAHDRLPSQAPQVM